MPVFIITISYLLLAAHSIRLGDMGLAVCFLGCGGLIFIKERWVAVVTTAVLGGGALLWIIKGAQLISLRIGFGEDWLRLGIIMGALFGVTFFSAILPLLPAGIKWFHRDPDKMWFKSAIFLLTALLLEIVRSKAPFPVLLLDRFFPDWGRAEIFILSAYAAWIGGKMFLPDGAKMIRPRIWAFFSVVFFFQLMLGLTGLDLFLMTGHLHLPVPALIVGGPVFRGSGFFMPILFAVSVFMVGSAWCSHLCYIGAWDDQFSRISGKRPSAKFPHALIWMRLILLILVVTVAWGFRVAGVSGTVAVLWAVFFGLIGLFVMLLFSRKMGMMVHCSSFCPMGIVANILGKVSPWRIKITSGCTMCGRCSRVCRYGALRKEDLKSGHPGLSCTLCGDCISPCTHGCIGYKLPFLSFDKSRKIFLVLTISFHALFLGVARM
ncbi:4Fe-4S binding protein [Desulfovibrio gilichinskyi]|uniref:4Fe-4S binding domain-containing protein n=1 Tax=Desulfovibrio gilichinskyi TaxID=1519643 RepID=A0A1X7DS09_9BACT|nr:4Fe-4S binding protein [Desulfovibrio gilichinskyi]SMF20627.1 4Fe-4S binding domain-containing protein [Desulfovibrio gilichinskyi]